MRENRTKQYADADVNALVVKMSDDKYFCGNKSKGDVRPSCTFEDKNVHIS